MSDKAVNGADFSARRNNIPEMIEVLKAYGAGKKIERRPVDKIVIIKKNENRAENFNRRQTISSRGYPAYEDNNGYIELEDVDHVENMPWREVDFPDFNFAEDQYRIKNDEI